MTDKWIINRAKTVGWSHIRDNIPCQDSVASLQQNGVSVIALSDGCGSSPLSQYGSDITVKSLCDLFANNYDVLYSSDDNVIRKTVVSSIVEAVKEFIKTNADMVSEFKRNNPWHYEKFKRNWPGYSQIDKIYPLTLFDATVQFVAVKGEKIIAGRLGDGIIADIHNGALKILSSEDKLGERNATWYPATILIASEKNIITPWEKFEIIKSNDAHSQSMFMLSSDGLERFLIVTDEDNQSEKHVNVLEIVDIIKSGSRLDMLLEEQYKPLKKVSDDDLSLIVLTKPKVFISSLVIREYDDQGQTINNKKTHKFDKQIEAEVFLQSDEGTKNIAETVQPDLEVEYDYSLNLFDEESNKKIEKYIKDVRYRVFFVEQASKILQYLEKAKIEQLDTVFALLNPHVDEDDWELMLKQFSKLKLFVIDKKKGTITRKEI